MCSVRSRDDGGEAEAGFGLLEIPRAQSPKSLELRATMSLPDCGPNRIYDWFAEGFNTTDLKGAKTLLDDFA